jgi:hypothetical protein
VEDELRVAGECKWLVDIVDSTLREVGDGWCLIRVNGIAYFVSRLNLLEQRSSEILSVIRLRETDQIVILFIVYAGLLSRITDSLQEGRLSGVGSPNDKNAESSVLLCGVGHGVGFDVRS